MDDRMLTRLLDVSAPATTDVDEVDAAVSAVARATRPRSTRRTLTAIAAGGALVLATGTAAAAGPQLLTHLGWFAEASTTQVASDGTQCAHGFRVAATPEIPPSPEALTIARDALLATDLDSIDISGVLESLEPDVAAAEVVEGEPWSPTAASVEGLALYIALSERVREAVAAEGFDPQSIQLDAATECDGPLTVPVAP